MATIICLANSWRDGGRCLAGIDLQSGKWVRPVPAGGGAFPEHCTRIGGYLVQPLDVLEIPLAAGPTVVRFQKENYEVLPGKWRRIRRATVGEVTRYCSANPRVLHNRTKVVQPSYLASLHPSRWTSLQLVGNWNVTFVPHQRDSFRWVACFSTSAADYKLTVTDPLTTARLNRGERLAKHCLLTASLTEPIAFPERGLEEQCYKLIVAVIEVET